MSDKVLRQETDQKVILSLLTSCKSESSSAFAWKLIGEQKITVGLKFSFVSKVSNELVFKSTPENFDQLRSLIGGDQDINIFLPNSNLIFQAKFKSLSNEGTLTLIFPKMMALPERRKSIRLENQNKVRMKVRFYTSSQGFQKKLTLFDKELFDISSGGLSFIITSLEGKFFGKDITIAGLHVQLDELELVLEGKIVNFIPIEPNSKNGLIYRGQKVCIQFTEIAQGDKEKINFKVFNLLNLEAA